MIYETNPHIDFSMSDEIRKLVTKLLDDRNLSALQVSNALGKNSAYINQFLKRGSPKYLPEGVRGRLANILGVDENILKNPSEKIIHKEIENKNSIPLIQPRVDVNREAHFGPDLIVVYGHVNGSGNTIMLNTDSEIGTTPRHPAQAGYKNVFAAETYGDSMSPRHRHGEMVYGVANQTPKRGQDCFIELHNGEAYLKEFCQITAKEVICKQLNPEKEWKRPISEVKSIHAVVR